jgi:hypothetical protein
MNQPVPPSLNLNGVTISLQNFGTRLAVFLQGEKRAIEQRYFALWNHGATNGELEWWCDNCAFIWIFEDIHDTAEDKLWRAMVWSAWNEIQNREETKGRNPMPEAIEIADKRISEMQWVNWYQQSAVWDMYDLGTSVKAEKETGNFNDDILGRTVQTAQTHSED